MARKMKIVLYDSQHITIHRQVVNYNWSNSYFVRYQKSDKFIGIQFH